MRSLWRLENYFVPRSARAMYVYADTRSDPDNVLVALEDSKGHLFETATRARRGVLKLALLLAAGAVWKTWPASLAVR